MSENRVLLDTAAFLDSPQALSITSAPTTEIREIAQRYLAACYDNLGKAPRFLDGEDMSQMLVAILPRHFGVKDPLAAKVEAVLDAYLRFLDESAVVIASYEQRMAFEAHIDEFRVAVDAGAAHRDGLAVTGKPKQVIHQVAKTGRNDPCPCGSGRKFKKCCMGIGS